MATEAPTEEQKFVDKIIGQIDKVLPPQSDDDVPLRPTVTLGEAVAAVASGSTEPGKVIVPAPAPALTEEEEAAAAKAAADKAEADRVAAQKVADEAKVAPKPPVRMRRKPPVIAPSPQIQPPAPQPAPAPNPDDDYIKGLTDVQQEQIEIARHAEAKGKKGLVAKAVEFFKKVDKFTEEHPEADPDGQEFQQFVEQNRPWNETDTRRMERDWIKDQAVEVARKTLEPTIQEQSRQLREMQLKPVIDGAVTSLHQAVTRIQESQEVIPVDQAVIDVLTTQGYEQAVANYPVEAPILQGSINATRAWMQISKGIRPVNPSSSVDTWLLDFINRQGENMARQPKENRTDGDGRTFLPMNQMIDAMRTDPQAAQKFWTFDDNDICDMIANEAVLNINHQIKTLERSGFKREPKKVSGSSGTPPAEPKPTETPSSGSPRAGGSSLPGAADTTDTVPLNEAQSFINTLVPGYLGKK